MDHFTIITTAASVVGTAIKLSKTLYDTIEALKDVPTDVRALCSTAESVKSSVSKLVVFMNDGKKCSWSENWLEDVTNDIDAIGEGLEEVQFLTEGCEGAGKAAGGKVKDARRRWKWHYNAEEIQKCTQWLSFAKGDLGLQISVI